MLTLAQDDVRAPGGPPPGARGATSTREDTSSLRKMFRMCVSTVFGLRKSASAISGFVLRSTTSRATCSSRPVSARRRSHRPCRGAVRRWTRWAEASQLALGRGAVSERAAGVKLGGGVLSSATARSGRPAWRARGPRASARARLDGAPTSSAAAAEASARSAASRNRRHRVRRPRRRDLPSNPPCGVAAPRPRPAHGGGRAFGVASAAEREPAAGEQLERPRPPDAGDERRASPPEDG